MEQLNSNHISHVKLETKKPKKNSVKSLIGYALLALVLGMFFLRGLVREECNPEFKIQKLEPTPGEDLTKWLKNYLDDNLILALTYFLYFVAFSLYYFSYDLTYKRYPMDIFIVPVMLGVSFVMTMFTRDYIVQDSSDHCKIELTKGLQTFLNFGGAYFTLITFIAFQHFLTKFCEKNTIELK